MQQDLDELSEDKISRVGITIRKAKNTEILNSLSEQLENGEQKISAILDMCEAELNTTMGNKQTFDDDFDLEEWVYF